MSNYLMKAVAKKVFKEHTSNNLGQSDAMYEEVEVISPHNGRTKITKQKRPLPPNLSQHNAKVLNRVRRRAHILDKSINICGIRFGLGSVVGIVPGIGDVADTILACMVLVTCTSVRPPLPPGVWRNMALNIFIDFFIGLLPFVGDLADALYKANSKNALLLEKALQDSRYKEGSEENMKALRNAAEKKTAKGALQSSQLAQAPAQSNRTHDQPIRSQQHEQHQHNDVTELGPPPRYETGLEGQDAATNSDVVTAPPATLSKQKSTGGSWLGRFGTTKKLENDLERGEVPPIQPARSARTIRQ